LPIIESNYKSPNFLVSGHAQTIFPFFFRKIKGIDYQREKLDTPDGGVLDIDWVKSPGNKKLLILSHGLEGHSQRNYILGMIRLFSQKGFDCLAWNYRSCGETFNKTHKFYHHGMTEDMELVVNHALKGKYNNISFVGFSLGGSITANYLGEKGENLPKEINRAVIFSTPFDLRSASIYFHSRLFNKVYLYRFMKTLKRKVNNRKDILQELGIDEALVAKIKDFHAFDELITAPVHGFKSKNEYYQKACPKQRLPDIRVPTLLINALNDPFLGPNCFPFEEAKYNPNIYLEVPKQGGHCGFPSFNNPPHYWSEIRALDFILKGI